MNKAKDTRLKLLYMFLPPLFVSPCWFFHQELLQKLSVPQHQDILLRVLIGVLLLLLYATSWIIYLHRHKRCPFCNSTKFHLINTKISNYPDLRNQGLIRYKYTCKSCNKNFEEYVVPSLKA